MKQGINSETTVDFETALIAAGTGKFQRKIVLVGGFALLCSYIAISGIAFVLPASQCDLNMDSKAKGNLISAGFLGIALSCHLWGFLSDTLGRHYILSRCLLADGLLYIITSLTPNYSLIVVWRFFNGFASCGGIVSLYAYVGEFHSNNYRLKALFIMSFLGCSAYFLLPVLAWIIIPGKWVLPLYSGLIYKPWRLYYACNGVPSLTCSFLLYFLPESPKFLLAKDEKSKALEVLQRIHKENSKKGEEGNFAIKNIVLNESEKVTKVDENSNKIKAFFILMWDQTIPLFKPPHRFCIVLICLTQFLLYLSNGGIYLWLPETLNRLANFRNEFGDKPATYCEVVQYKKPVIHYNSSVDQLLMSINNSAILQNSTDNTFIENFNQQQPSCKDEIDFSVYLHSVIFGLALASTMAVCVFLTSFFDKKFIIEFCLILSLLAAIFLLKFDFIQIIPVIMNVIIVLSGAVIVMINSVAVDLFPTNMRAMASCFTLMCSRLGTVTTNALAGIFIDTHCSVLLWCFIASFTVTLILIFLLPSKPPYLKEEKEITVEI